VSAVLVIVGNIVTPKSPETRFMQRNDVVEQFATNAAHPPFGSSVLPGTTEGRANRLEITRLQEVQHLVAELGIMVE
jgi:hypothetical protein